MDIEDFWGKQIEIIELAGQITEYNGKRGRVVYADWDFNDDFFLYGTWGKLVIYPARDKIKIIS